MSQYIDVGWTGAPEAVAAALAAFGYRLDANNTFTATDRTLAGPIVAVTGYQVIDGVAYVLIRSTDSVPFPLGVGDVGPEMIVRLAGVFFSADPATPSLDPVDLTFLGENVWQSSIG